MRKTFKFTNEQLRKIYDGDLDARNTFYFDNLDIIKRMACFALQSERHPTVTHDDLVQGVYVDMDYFCCGYDRPVTNGDEIGYFIRWSFHLAPYGGLAYCRENNPKIMSKSPYGSYDRTYTDNNPLRLDMFVDDSDKHLQSDGRMSYAECIPDPRSDFIEQSDICINECVNALGQYLRPKLYDCFILLVDGYTDTQISKQLGITQSAATQRKYNLRKAFVKYLDDVVNLLAIYGINADGIAQRKPKHHYKTDEKQRRRMAEYYRRKRAKENTPHDVA